MSDLAILSKEIYKTTNYKQFKRIASNRPVDKSHVAYLVQKIKDEGNLTPDFPIIVNEHLEVIDGQHRIEALKVLEFPVYYEKKAGLNANSIRTINTGTKNWDWRAHAHFYSQNGNKNYTQFLELFKLGGGIRYSVVLIFASLSIKGQMKWGGKRSFAEGELIIKNYELSKKLLLQYKDFVEATGFASRDFGIAAYEMMTTPGYKHEETVINIEMSGEELHRCYTLGDYRIALEKLKG